MSNSKNPADRIQWIDIAKGIVMLLVIFAHCLGTGVAGQVVRGAIFSFHMPIFFCLSAVTFHFSENIAEWKSKSKKAFQHLILPALITFLLVFLAQLIMGRTEDRFLIKKLLSLLFASGIWNYIGSLRIPEIGVIWFLFALFTGRTVYDFVHLRTTGAARAVLLIALTLSGIIIGQYLQLPFSFDVALAVFPFFFLGEHFSALKLEERKCAKILACVALWCITLILSFYVDHMYFELACRRYTLFPLCYFGAAAGIILVYYFSSFLSGLSFPLKNQLLFIGRNSLTLLCVHAMDFVWDFAWNLQLNEFICALLRIITDICVFYLIMYIKKRSKA